jgi:hypothetical protein
VTPEADESLPFDVEIERLPAWVHGTSAVVVVVGVLVALKIVPMLAFLPFLIVSAMGRRFASSAMHIEVDAEGLDLGGREVSRAEISDVWADEEPRVTLALGDELVVLNFESHEQAHRFASELSDPKHVAVAGYRPRPIDALSCLRYLAMAAAFFGTGSWLGLVPLPFFVLGAWTFARARQLVARPDGYELRGAFGVSTTRDASRSHLIDPLLASPAWLGRAKRRVVSDFSDRL